jgi:hypothetical protein
VVKAIYNGSEFIAATSGDEDFGLVLESTSFYAEQGGQVQLHFTWCNCLNGLKKHIKCNHLSRCNHAINFSVPTE